MGEAMTDAEQNEQAELIRGRFGDPALVLDQIDALRSRAKQIGLQRWAALSWQQRLMIKAGRLWERAWPGALAGSLCAGLIALSARVLWQ